MAQKQIFREKALEKLSSPDNIHELVQVTTAKSWFVLAGLGIIIFTFVIWAMVGKIPKNVSGQGILIQAGGIIEINALGSGIVRQVYVKEGDIVQKYDTIAIVSQPEAEIQIQNMQKKLAYLKAKRHKLVQNIQDDTQFRQLLLEKYRLEEQVYRTEQLQNQWRERTAYQRQNLQNKAIIESSLLKAQAELKKIDKENAYYDSTLYVLNQRLALFNNPAETYIEQYDNEINELQRNFEEQYAKFVLNSYIKSQYEGKIVELTIKQGQLLEAGALIANIERKEFKKTDLQAVVYVAAEEGKKILPKMKAKIAPSTISVEEYGYMEGEVVAVSEYPSTKQGMMRLLSNADLVETFSKGAPPIAVKIRLIPNPNNASGYQWTSVRGPDSKIQAGTLCQARIVVYQQRPIAFMLPFLKENIHL